MERKVKHRTSSLSGGDAAEQGTLRLRSARPRRASEQGQEDNGGKYQKSGHVITKHAPPPTQYDLAAFLRIPCEGVQDNLDGHFIAHAGINHQVETMPSRPVDVEISFNEVRAVAVDSLDEFCRFLLAFSCQSKAPDSFLKGSINEDMKSVGAFAEVICRPSAHNHAIAGVRDFRQEFLHHLTNALGIHHLQPRGVQATFKAALHERFEEPVVHRISLLFVLFHGAAIAVHPPRDLLGQGLIPELPAQPRCQTLCDLAASAAVFPLQSDNSHWHNSLAHPAATSPPPPGLFGLNAK